MSAGARLATGAFAVVADGAYAFSAYHDKLNSYFAIVVVTYLRVLRSRLLRLFL